MAAEPMTLLIASLRGLTLVSMYFSVLSGTHTKIVLGLAARGITWGASLDFR